MTSQSSAFGTSTNQTQPRTAPNRRMHALAAVGFTALLVAGCSPASADNTEPKPDAPASDVQKTDAPAAEKSAYVSQPYDPALLEAAYPSDGHHKSWIPILDGYDELLKNHQDILDRDMEIVVEINGGSAKNPEQRERALDDQYEDMSMTMGEGMGQNLGKIYMDGRKNGDLPKIDALLTKGDARAAGEGASSNPAKEHWKEQAPRPYVAHPDAIDYFDREGGDAHDSRGGAYPSGHTSEAYWQGVIMATLLPELSNGILARVSEAGNNRIVMGAHYPTDVIGGRMSGTSLAANRWADEEFHVLFDGAREELVGYLESECGDTLEACIEADTPFMTDDEANKVYLDRMTYGFKQIGEAGQPLVVPEKAGSLLLTSHPDLTDEQRLQVLELTAIDSGYPLDKQGEGGGWQRLNLMAAMDADVEIDGSGNVQLAK
ncbi:phosphatase PAP2 family protein [Jonesiaceae bacterium BS-20]|uniref:Phosphatase PAP2 family protein n=1 Tax=Jonesiaceae bacterium BS-20 TaxID=3120821 RepID=A0AAU7DWE8_9MICO